MDIQDTATSARDRMRAMRDQYGSSVTWIASRIGLPNRNYVYFFEEPRKHQGRLNYAHLQKIARYFGLDVEGVLNEYLARGGKVASRRAKSRRGSR